MKPEHRLVFVLTSLTVLSAATTFSREAYAATPTLKLVSNDNVTVSSSPAPNTVNNYKGPGATAVTSGQDTYFDSTSIVYAIQTNGTAIFTLNGGSVTDKGGGAGIDAEGTGLITINGGTIAAGSKGYGIYNNNQSPITINGGTFSAPSDGVDLGNNSGTISLYGGMFSTTGTDFNNKNGTISLYGSFNGPSGKALAVGQTEILAAGGSFTGTLQNNSMPQTFSYLNSGSGTITLYDTRTAAPEPSEWAALAFTGLGVGGLLLRARRRSVRPRA